MSNPNSVSLVVDLDGTLVHTDTLVESVFRLLKKNPLLLFALPFWVLQGRASLKQLVAQRIDLNPALLPYNHDVLDYLRSQKAQGRVVHLATAAHESIATSVSSHLQLFDSVLASSDGTNLKGKRKLEEIQQRIGTDFSYAGDSSADIPIWKQAKSAILVGVSSRTMARLGDDIEIEKEFSSPKVTLKVFLKAIRIHQWMKNCLIFVPLLTAFAFTNVPLVIASLHAFLGFSLMASATYILNDLWDLDADRIHPRKRNRPLASGALSIPQGILIGCSMLAFGLAIGGMLSLSFLLMMVLYLVTTLSYSFVFKTYIIIDIIFLSLLFTIRILSGAVAIEVPVSAWLLSFSVLVFFSLALVKRCSELVSLKSRSLKAASGRDYQVSDLVILWPLGVSTAVSAVVVFGLFINDSETQAKYATPELLWGAAIGLIYWLSRLWIKTARGEMHDDPIVFALKNLGSVITVGGIALWVLAAHFIDVH
ncbi:Decaprenyl-phosphate phosphoribosyltransferase [Stieleria bergensis]|uniref:Decaprenyl-phosphate phosphoribosyltransferase n=1 Tax=Stieleria bergensis TaxID=2528025 RepID=A0A517T245_9BACT|nr:Decaprenyl-phosphate phosphoribosyltransferase [Planctomycetes bacterium SV_7m_r]